MKEIHIKDLKEGDKFRFIEDNKSKIRIAVQIGKTEIYCPHQGSDPYDSENEVYLKGNRTVLLIE